MSKGEIRVYDILKRNYGGYRILREVALSKLIEGSKSRQRVDFYIQELGVAVEVDGEQHATNVKYFTGSVTDTQPVKDAKKNLALRDAGLAVVRCAPRVPEEYLIELIEKAAKCVIRPEKERELIKKKNFRKGKSNFAKRSSWSTRETTWKTKPWNS